MKITIVATGMLMLVSSVAAQAQILKCVGRDGKIEFATACPPGTKQQDTGVSSVSKPAPPPAKDEKGDKGDKGDKGGKAADKGADKGKAAEKAAPLSLADREAESRKTQKAKAEADAKAEKAAADDARRKIACDDSRSNLKRYQDRQRSVRVDPKTGERHMFEEQDFVRETANAERAVAENCK